jgi:hypothetical protein
MKHRILEHIKIFNLGLEDKSQSQPIKHFPTNITMAGVMRTRNRGILKHSWSVCKRPLDYAIALMQ